MKTLLSAVAASFFLAGSAGAQAPASTFLTTDRPVATNEVKIGVSVAQSGRSGAVGLDYLKGARVYFDRLNEREGGIHQRKVKLIAYDDRYEVLACTLNTRRLINEDKVFALLNYMGGVNTRAAGQMITEAQIPLVGAFTGAQTLRQPINRYLFHIRPGFFEEAALIVERLITDRSVTKIAVFHQADSDGDGVLRGVERALRPRGIAVAASASAIRNTVDVAAAVETMLQARPDAIVLGTSYQASALFVKGLKARGFSPIIVGTSFVGAEQFAEFAGQEAANGVYFSQVVPLPTEASVPLVKAFQDDMKGSPDFSATHAALEGYLNAAVMAQALRDTGANLNAAAFLKALENLNADIGGVAITFTPSTRQGSKDFYLNVVRAGQLAKVEKFTP